MWTPLILASKKGHIESMKVLLEAGANVYAQDLWKFTCLHYAAFNCYFYLFQILKKKNYYNYKID